MATELSPAEKGKVAAAVAALEFIQPDMKIGLGTGSTAAWLVKLLAKRIQSEQLQIHACATSTATTELAQSLGIKIHSIDALGQLDIAIDGADEFDPDFNLIKGGGAALLQEKIVESATDKLVIITDPSKEVETLGKFPLPVEIVKFGCQTTKRLVEEVLQWSLVDGKIASFRGGDNPIVTDEGHYLLDLHVDKIEDPENLSQELNRIPGVVETGLFLGMANEIIVGQPDGTVRIGHYQDGTPHWSDHVADGLFDFLSSFDFLAGN